MVTRVANDVEGPWTPDPEIPAGDHVYARVLLSDWLNDDHRPKPKFFRNSGGGMSVDWCRYCHDPELTRRRAENDRAPEEYGVIRLNVGKIRSIMANREALRQDCIHTLRFEAPGDKRNNRAHSDVTGPKSRTDGISRADSTEIRALYLSYSDWAIPPPEPSRGTSLEH